MNDKIVIIRDMCVTCHQSPVVEISHLYVVENRLIKL